MGTAVPSEAQEGNKYILTLIMKAIVAYALAAFAAIASNSIEATPVPSPLYEPAQNSPIAAHFIRQPRHADEQPYEYDYDYGVASAKHDTYSDENQHRLTKREEYPEEYAPQYYSHLEEARLTKREDLDTYLDAEADPRKKRSPIDLDSAVSEPR